MSVALLARSPGARCNLLSLVAMPRFIGQLRLAGLRLAGWQQKQQRLTV